MISFCFERQEQKYLGLRIVEGVPGSTPVLSRGIPFRYECKVERDVSVLSTTKNFFSSYTVHPLFYSLDYEYFMKGNETFFLVFLLSDFGEVDSSGQDWVSSLELGSYL